MRVVASLLLIVPLVVGCAARRVRVVDPNGGPIQGAQVQLFYNHSLGGPTATTDEKGEARFDPDFLERPLWVRISKKDFITVSVYPPMHWPLRVVLLNPSSLFHLPDIPTSMLSTVLPLASLLERAEAEKLLPAMEARLGEARAIECDVDVVLQFCPPSCGKGSLLIGEGNKHRIEMRALGEEGLRPAELVSVSDGKQVSRGDGVVQDMPAWQNQALKTGLGRAGLLMMVYAPAELRPDQAFRVTDVRFFEQGVPGPQGARPIRYTLIANGWEPGSGQKRFVVNLWIDAETKLPVKRVVVPVKEDARAEDEPDFVLTETYERLLLDGKLDAGKFDLLGKN